MKSINPLPNGNFICTSISTEIQPHDVLQLSHFCPQGPVAATCAIIELEGSKLDVGTR